MDADPNVLFIESRSHFDGARDPYEEALLAFIEAEKRG